MTYLIGLARPSCLQLLGLATLLVMLTPVGALRADVDSDLFLFTTSVPPNVAIVLDNSGSMNEIVWHPAYDPTVDPSCNEWADWYQYGYSSTVTFSRCGNTRTLYHDPESYGSTRISGRYLNWLFSDESDLYVSELNDSANGFRLCSLEVPATFGKYHRNRMTAAKQVVLETICLIAATKDVRFGLGLFREGRNSSWNDPNGGYMSVGIDDLSAGQQEDIDDAVALAEAETWTPLGETLFQIYTYFMGRSSGQQPAPAQSGSFPSYSYSTSASSGGGPYSSSGPPTVPDCPVEFSCQKNFVIIITDGEPTRDDFDTDPASTSAGFSNFGNLIGDFNSDGETETGGSYESALYLDDIAKFMHEQDFRPDLTGDQLIDVYTIGFTTNGPANVLLEKTAEQGNGLFFTSNNAEELTVAIVASITDIIEKSQSFTAATVPSTRTASGGDFYTSFFLPSAKSPFWEGHLRAFGIDAAGNLFDQNGICPLVDPTPGECNSGPFAAGNLPYWDAGEEIPLPAERHLYTTRLSGSNPTRIAFETTTLNATDLDLLPFASPPDPTPNPIYPGSDAVNSDGLAEEIVSYARGCDFSTGVSGPNVAADSSCVARDWRLGDIFHSAPAVVGQPRAAMGEASYSNFAANFASRQRIIYFGANDGFLHAINAGTWDAAATPPAYTQGTGEEIFGFMPWESRKQIKNLPIDDASDRHYYVDGSPESADVWLYPSSTTGSKALNGSEWRTYLITGLRGGGRSFLALDVTDPTDPNFPQHAWDFPSESDPDDPAVPTSILPYLGESWSQPVITRIRVQIGADDNSGQGYERWVMIVGGGYSAASDPNEQADYDPLATAGRSIAIVDIKTGLPLAMKRFNASAAAGDPERDMMYAIPSTPTVLDLDFDGFADVILVGDLGGQVWKWVIKPVGDDRVHDSSAPGDYSQPNWSFEKFFEAPITNFGGLNYYKSIYFPLAAAYQGKILWYSFATGERSNIQFPGFSGADENNRMYALRDVDPLETSGVATPTLTESDLMDRSTIQGCTNVLGSGYFFSLVDGEKIVTNVEIFADLVLAGSFTPATGGDPCTSKGSGVLYVFELSCGGGYFSEPGGSPTRALAIGEGMPTDPQISVGADGKDNIVFVEKSGADLESIQAPDVPSGAKTLLYWREMD